MNLAEKFDWDAKKVATYLIVDKGRSPKGAKNYALSQAEKAKDLNEVSFWESVAKKVLTGT